jgi:polyhydroxyalkanoate synthesis repressor PhaR
MLVKKYGNRRLYDTEQSRYVRLDEIAERVRAGADVQVVDAKSGVDLTAPTLAQIIFEDRNAARLLPFRCCCSSSAWETSRWRTSWAGT